MKKLILLVFVFVSCTALAFADWNTYETKQEAWDRRSYENYNTYQNNDHQQPLGGYNRPINDDGGRQFGTNYGNQGFNSLNSNHSRNYSKNSNSWNNY